MKHVPLNLAFFGGLLAVTALALGAFGAHALENIVSPERLDTFETAVRYQMYHGLALLAFAALPFKAPLANSLILLGTLIFSGSLYALVMLNLPVLGAITPIGGVLQIAGWLVFLSRSWSSTKAR